MASSCQMASAKNPRGVWFTQAGVWSTWNHVGGCPSTHYKINIYIWLVVSNMNGLWILFSIININGIIIIWDVIPTPLTNSMIFQDGWNHQPVRRYKESLLMAGWPGCLYTIAFLHGKHGPYGPWAWRKDVGNQWNSMVYHDLPYWSCCFGAHVRRNPYRKWEIATDRS